MTQAYVSTTTLMDGGQVIAAPGQAVPSKQIETWGEARVGEMVRHGLLITAEAFAASKQKTEEAPAGDEDEEA